MRQLPLSVRLRDRASFESFLPGPNEVALTQIQDGVAVVSAGLKVNDRVVVDGQYKLKPGSKVQEASKGVSGASGGTASASGAGK